MAIVYVVTALVDVSSNIDAECVSVFATQAEAEACILELEANPAEVLGLEDVTDNDNIEVMSSSWTKHNLTILQ